MSFGKRSLPQQSAKTPKPLPDLQVEEQDIGSGSSILIPVLSAITVTLVLIALSQTITGSISALPLKATTVTYKASDRILARLLKNKSPKQINRLEAKLGIDFSVILTPYEEEETTPMQKVAESCLPQAGYQRRVMPFYSETAFIDATNYLNCAMTYNKDRLCNSKEKKRFIAQLQQYITVRASLWGVRRSVNTFHVENNTINNMKNSIQVLANVKTMQRVALERAAMFGMPMGGSRRNKHLSSQRKYQESNSFLRLGTDQLDQIITDKLDANFEKNMQNLIKDGYLTASDFGWFGLIIPADYAPLFQGRYVKQNKCEGNKI